MVAKGQIHQITQEFNVQEGNIFMISMDDAVSSLIAPGTWYWRRTGSKMPMLQPLIQLHNEQRSSIYFQSRDAYRLKRGEDGHWMGSSLALAAKCWNQIASGVFGSNIALKNCLDKYYHGRNRAKGLAGSEAQRMSTCHICGMNDSQKHIILECEVEELERLRKVARDNVKSAAREEKRQHGRENKYIARIANFIVEKGFDMQYIQYDRIWTGLWNASVLSDAFTFGTRNGEKFPEMLNYQTICLIQDSIGRISSHLTSALRDIMRVHREAGLTEVEENGYGNVCTHRDKEEAKDKSNNSKSAQNLEAIIEEPVFAKPVSHKNRRGKLYGGRYRDRVVKTREKKSVCRKRREEELKLELMLSQKCKIVVDKALRGEGSIAEDTSHPMFQGS